MKKRVFAALCALALALCAACTPAGAASGVAEPTPTPAAVSAEPTPQSSYPDVSPGDWFYNAVEEMTARGILSGIEGGLFAPHMDVTRATIVLVLWRLEGNPEVAESEDFTPFPDTEEWYAEAANWAKSVGIATGYGPNQEGYAAGAFGGRDPLTREQLAVFLYRYAQYKGEPVAEGMLGLYSDAFAIGSWAEAAMRHVVGLGILQGGDGNKLNPRGVADRAELAVMLQRMLTPAAG